MSELSDKIADLLNRASSSMLEPSAIFTIPVHYLPPFPYPLVVRNDHTQPMKPSECAKIIVVDRWNDLEPLGYSNAPKEREIVFQAKVRPFLVLRRFERRINMQTYKCVLGLPITTVTDEMQANENFMEKLRSKQAVSYYLLDPVEKPETSLRNKSMVLIPAPYVLPEEYFIRRKGYVYKDDFDAIHSLLVKFISGQNNELINQGG